MATGGGRYWLYDHEHERLDDFMKHLDGVLAGDSRRTASVAVLVSKEGVKAGIEHARSPRFDASVRAGRPGSGMFTVHLARKDGEAGRILVAKAPGSFVHLAITDEPRRFVEGTLAPFIRSLYPRVSRAFLSSADLYSILERLERSSGGRISAARLTACGRLRTARGSDHGGAGASRRAHPRRRRTTEAAVTYTDRPFREAFSAAAANDQWISRIGFDLQEGAARAPMSGHLARNGLFRFRHGISPFCGKALPLAVGLVDRKTRLYSNRSREDNGGDIRPLAITLDITMAGDHSENSAFIKSMESMPHITLSVYHSNPYVHVSLVD